VGPQFINALCCSTASLIFLPLVLVSQWSWEPDFDVQVIVTWQPALLMWIWHHGKDIM
jgi:hypothetical protein